MTWGDALGFHAVIHRDGDRWVFIERPRAETMSESQPEMRLDQLHERHIGLTPALAGTFTEAAAVCLARHHTSPVLLEVVSDRTATSYVTPFEQPSTRTLNAWANVTDATEAGAYGVCLAAVEAESGLIAIKRAETLTGADWYVAPKGSTADDLEDSFRLEVSGVDAGNRTAVESRLRQKVEQTRRGSSNLPAIAGVVGFKEKTVLVESVGAAL